MYTRKPHPLNKTCQEMIYLIASLGVAILGFAAVAHIIAGVLS